MTKDRQWTPRRIEVMDSIRMMSWTPLREQVKCANGEVGYQDDNGHR